MNFKILLSTIFISIVSAFLVVPVASGQRREHLTYEEIELVRDVQDVDLRMEIFVRAIERRLLAIDGEAKLTSEQSKQISKESEKWGPLPTGSQSELISDIEKILNEAIDKFEDVYEQEPKNDLLPYAYFILADYSESLIPILRNLGQATSDTRMIGMLEQSLNSCNDVLEVRDKFQRPTVKRKKRKNASE